LQAFNAVCQLRLRFCNNVGLKCIEGLHGRAKFYDFSVAFIPLTLAACDQFSSTDPSVHYNSTIYAYQWGEIN
jgi:hypothetical protein